MPSDRDATGRRARTLDRSENWLANCRMVGSRACGSFTCDCLPYLSSIEKALGLGFDRQRFVRSVLCFWRWLPFVPKYFWSEPIFGEGALTYNPRNLRHGQFTFISLLPNRLKVRDCLFLEYANHRHHPPSLCPLTAIAEQQIRPAGRAQIAYVDLFFRDARIHQ